MPTTTKRDAKKASGTKKAGDKKAASKTLTVPIQFRAERDVLDFLDAEGEKEHRSRSDMIRMALREFRERRGG
jgi:hypothetical protein